MGLAGASGGPPASQPRHGCLLGSHSASRAAIEADTHGASDRGAQILSQGPAELLWGHNPIERSQDVVVDAQLQPAPALIHGEGRGPGLGQLCMTTSMPGRARRAWVACPRRSVFA
jgi:hypothetical protein